MKARTIAAAMMVLALGVVITGCGGTPVAGAEDTGESVIFSAEGVAVANGDSELDAAKAKIAAETNAKAALLEKIKGAWIKAGASTTDLGFVGHNAAAKLSGQIARVKVTSVRKIDSITWEATAQLQLTEDEYEAIGAYID